MRVAVDLEGLMPPYFPLNAHARMHPLTAPLVLQENNLVLMVPKPSSRDPCQSLDRRELADVLADSQVQTMEGCNVLSSDKLGSEEDKNIHIPVYEMQRKGREANFLRGPGGTCHSSTTESCSTLSLMIADAQEKKVLKPICHSYTGLATV